MNILSSRIAGADGLRAIACLLVVWHHTAQKFNPENSSLFIKSIHFLGMRGEVGVSLFFVLSGCLLSMPFWAAFFTGEAFPSMRRYAMHRAARIAPAFWLNLLACNIIGLWAFDIEINLKKFISGIFFINSYHYSTFFPADLNGPLWSIGLEVSCYVLLPVVLYSVTKRAKKFTSALAILVSFIFFLQVINPAIIRFFMTDGAKKGWEYGQIGGAKLWLPYWNIGSFFSQFLIGSLAALLITWMRSKKVRNHKLFDLGALTMVVVASIFVVLRLNPGSPDSFTQQPYLAPFYALFMATVLIFSSHSIFIFRWLDNPPFVMLAKLSFSIYLWHVVLMEIIARKFLPSYIFYGLEDTGQWISISALILFMSTVIALASWRWIESPILEFVRRRSRPTGPSS